MNNNVLKIIRRGMGESYLLKNDLYRYGVRDNLRPMVKHSLAFSENETPKRERYLPEDQQRIDYVPGEEDSLLIKIIKAAANLFLKIISFFRKVYAYFTKIKNMFTDQYHWLNIAINKLESLYDKYLKNADFSGTIGEKLIIIPIDLAEPYLMSLKTKMNDAMATAGAKNGYDYSQWNWTFELGPMEFDGRMMTIIESSDGLLDEIQLHKLRKVLASDKLKGMGAVNVQAVSQYIELLTGNTDLRLSDIQKYFEATIINARKLVNVLSAMEIKVKDTMNHMSFMVSWAERVSSQLKDKLQDKEYRKKLDADIDEKFIYQGAVKLTPDELIRENMNVAKKIMESNTFHINQTKSQMTINKMIIQKEIGILIKLANVAIDIHNEYIKK